MAALSLTTIVAVTFAGIGLASVPRSSVPPTVGSMSRSPLQVSWLFAVRLARSVPLTTMAVSVSFPQWCVALSSTVWPAEMITSSPTMGTIPPTQVVVALERPDWADVRSGIV